MGVVALHGFCLGLRRWRWAWRGPAVCARQGLDVGALLDHQLVDVLVVSDVMTVSDGLELSAWRDRGALLVAGLPQRKPRSWNFPRDFANPAGYGASVVAERSRLASAARVLLAEGASGLELFNFAGEVRTPATQEGLEATVAAVLNPGAQPPQLAVTSRNAAEYEGRLEQVKRLPVEFRNDGKAFRAFVNDLDGALLPATNDRWSAPLRVRGWATRLLDEVWYLRLGIGAAARSPDPTGATAFSVVVNGSLLFRGRVDSDDPSLTVVPLPRPDGGPVVATMNVVITVPGTFPLREGENTVTIYPASGSDPFAILQLELGPKL
ncbi:MAG: hypothetical protein IPL40_07625 [Proteobacteria bacterium]|nr:hypothetical protein [Pseudomonadota bacterium]